MYKNADIYSNEYCRIFGIVMDGGGEFLDNIYDNIYYNLVFRQFFYHFVDLDEIVSAKFGKRLTVDR